MARLEDLKRGTTISGFLLADDPGAGKTIMAGLLIKELMARGDVRRCMVVCPGKLVEQCQDELHSKFNLAFEAGSTEKIRSARSDNWFRENDLVITRLDKLARDEDCHRQLEQTDWDLIVVDEAHKMSAHRFGNEIKRTQRHKLGRLLSGLARHFLLMTATPHNGKEQDFQLFMSLIDADRVEGRFRAEAHEVDASDLMRRMVKEDIVRFDGGKRWAIAWFEQHGMEEGPYGTAETLATAKNTSVSGLGEAGFLESGGGTVRLLSRDELADDWDPTVDGRLTFWEVTEHLIRALENEGETGAAELLARIGSAGEVARDLSYRLYTTCERREWAQEALAYNTLVTAWPEISRLARSAPPRDEQMELETEGAP